MSIRYLVGRVIHMDYKAMLKKINSIHKKTGKSRLSIFNDMRICATKYGAGYMDYDLFEMYNLTPEERDTYLTRGRNNDLIKKYNNPDSIHIFHNKDEFNTKFKKYIKRDWISLNDSKEKVLEFMTNHDTFMLKPLSGTCGKGIRKINSKDYPSIDKLYEEIINEGISYELEEVIEQNKLVGAIYPDAINTVRIVTILDDADVPNVICAYFRIGNGKYVDNFNSGGMVAPVSIETGEVIDKAIDKNKNLYEFHPLTGQIIKGFKFPDWDKALELVKKASLEVKDVRYVGWDVCFSKKGPILVEGNEYPGHDIYQLPEHTPDKIGIMPKFNKVMKK